MTLWKAPVEDKPLWTLPETAKWTPPEEDKALWTIPKSETADSEVALWEKPKEWSEEAMQGVGNVISNVPVLPKLLQWTAPAFEWVSENLENPWAAIITSPFSPSLRWEQGESWIDHQKREYESWKAPTYVKGLAEFSMPLWWIPWLGWAGKGAKALGATNKMTEALSKVGRIATKVHLPTDEVLDNTLFKKDFFKTVAQWSESKPVLSAITKRIGGISAVVKSPGVEDSALDITKRALIKRGVISDMRYGVKGLLTPKIQALGDPIKVLDIAPDALVRSVVAKDGTSTYLSDLIEGYVKNPGNYTFSTPKAKQMVNEIIKSINEIRELAIKEGVKVPKEFTFHRSVKGVETEVKGEYEAAEFGSRFDMARHRETMKAGATGEGGKRIVQYENNPLKIVNSTIDNYVKKIADKRFNDEVGKLGQNWLEKYSALYPEEAKKITESQSKILSAKYASNSIQSILTRNGTRLPPATLAKIRRGMPELADQLDQALSFTPETTDKVISAMGKEFWKEAKITPKEFKVQLAQSNKTRGKILMSELDDTIHSLNVENKTAVTAIENAYKEVYKNITQLQKNSFKALLNESDNILKTTKGDLQPLMSRRTEWKKSFGEGFGANEAVFRSHPAFGNKLFPKEVVDFAEPVLKDKGNQWLKGMSEISGVGRTLVAAMDFSAPFIQGLAVLGSNPVAWAKGVVRQFEFFAKPKNFYKYMSQKDTMAIRAERIAFGGSSQTFEYMEAVPEIQKVLGKKITGATYGRAETSFTGYGEVVRNEMWKALRNKAVKNGVVDEQIARDLSRSIDRMTGVMSSESLGLSKSQREFENAFMFFAPRYTRASLAYVGDIFKGGVSGAEARKSLSALMASGAMFYYGACKVTGQEPNFNINSADFMTLKVGNQKVGIGGSFYGIARMMANVVGKSTTEPLDLVRISKDDNPFIKFMYQRTSPLTGTIVNVIENENYMGKPFESPADWGRYLAEKVTPIALQDFIQGEQGIGTVANVFGARTFPKSGWELQEEAKENASQRLSQTSYENLSGLDKKTISKLPEVTMFQSEIDKRTVQIGDALSIGFMKRQREIDDAKDSYINQLNEFQTAYDKGLITALDFKDNMQNAKYGYGATLEHINSNTEYTDVLKKLQSPKDVSKDYIGDIAYGELQDASYSGKFEQYGIFNFDKYNQFRETLRRKYGESVWNYVLQRESQGDKDLPPLAQEYEHAKEVLKPYWGVTDRVKNLGINPESKIGQKLVSKLRKIELIRNPETLKMYNLFYRQQ